MSTPDATLALRIRCNRLRLAVACVELEDDIHAAARYTQLAHSALRIAKPVALVAGVAWALRKPSIGQGGKRLLGLLMGARTILRVYTHIRTSLLR